MHLQGDWRKRGIERGLKEGRGIAWLGIITFSAMVCNFSNFLMAKMFLKLAITTIKKLLLLFARFITFFSASLSFPFRFMLLNINKMDLNKLKPNYLQCQWRMCIIKFILLFLLLIFNSAIDGREKEKKQN